MIALLQGWKNQWFLNWKIVFLMVFYGFFGFLGSSLESQKIA